MWKLGEPFLTNAKSVYTALQFFKQHYKKQIKPGTDKTSFF